MHSAKPNNSLLFLLIMTSVGVFFAFIIIAKADRNYYYFSSLADSTVDSLAARDESYSQNK